MKDKQVFLTSSFTVKGMDDEDESIKIEGYANTTTKDRMGDIVLEEAWVKGGMDNYLKNPIVLAYHDYKAPIGSVTDYSVSSKGLKVTATISKAAGDVYNLVKNGILKAFSIGFMVKDADYDSATNLFVIKDLELYEISVVSVPANTDSTFAVSKSFDDLHDFDEFKDSFNKTLELASDITGEENVDKDKISLTPAELNAQKEKAVAEALAKIEADKVKADAAKSVAIEAGKTGAEAIIAEVEKRFEEKNASVNEALEGLRTELKEKNDEIVAMQKSKMSFEDKDTVIKLDDKTIDNAVLLSKIMGKKVTETEYFKGLVEKAGEHLGGTYADEYETEFNTRMFSAVSDRLVLEPLFTNRVTMNSRSMVFPFNPEAGYAQWIADTAYKSSDDSSTGYANNHAINDISIKAEKLATKEAIGYEEEEDSIIPILPIVLAAVARRMARTTDLELMRGNVGTATVAGASGTGSGLINGIATLAGDASQSYTQGGTYGSTNPITITDLQGTRRLMGTFGMNPSDVVYIVNQSVYFDLIEDPDFRTTDMVGTNATILTGQIGAVNGSPVIVSDAFATPAAGALCGVALNASNYLFGTLRGMTTERDRDVLNQKNWLVSTRRFAFKEIIAMATGESSCVEILYGA